MPDIKEWLRAAAGSESTPRLWLTNAPALAPGEVIKPESLNFLDAMNALEMMDPAMDWGVNISPKGTFDPAALLTPQQLCWIMDEMSARELAWHQGGTLAQTVYTSLHYHNTLLVSPRVERTHPDFPALEACTAALRAWVLGYAKSIEVAYHALLDANGAARDGEDVWLDAYGIPIETTETADEVATYLESETAWLAADAGRASDPWWANVLLRLRFRAVSWAEGSGDEVEGEWAGLWNDEASAAAGLATRSSVSFLPRQHHTAHGRVQRTLADTTAMARRPPPPPKSARPRRPAPINRGRPVGL